MEPPVDNQSVITFDLDFFDEEEDVQTRVDGRLTVDSRGQKGKKRSSVGGSAVADLNNGMTFTIALAGKEAKAKKCRKVRNDLQDLFGVND